VLLDQPSSICTSINTTNSTPYLTTQPMSIVNVLLDQPSSICTSINTTNSTPYLTTHHSSFNIHFSLFRDTHCRWIGVQHSRFDFCPKIFRKKSSIYFISFSHIYSLFTFFLIYRKENSWLLLIKNKFLLKVSNFIKR